MSRPATKRELVEKVRRHLRENDKHRPFSKNGIGDPDKDYYRGQHDALLYVLCELTGSEDY